jgi:riboflavin transporter FmnP
MFSCWSSLEYLRMKARNCNRIHWLSRVRLMSRYRDSFLQRMISLLRPALFWIDISLLYVSMTIPLFGNIVHRQKKNPGLRTIAMNGMCIVTDFSAVTIVIFGIITKEQYFKLSKSIED